MRSDSTTAVADAASYRHYPTKLFAAAEAYAGACTAKSTIYCANIAARLMVAQFAKFLRRLPVEVDVQVNLLASELMVGALASSPHSSA